MSRDHGSGLSDAAALATIGVVVVVTGTLWLWGGVAGALFGAGWPAVGIGQLLAVLVRLPSRLSDPAAAWPTAARPLLPGAGGFYGALAILAGAGAVLVLAAGRVGVRLGSGGGGARWARTPELRRLRSLGRTRRTGRLVLGRHGGRLLCAEQRHALVAFGPPQSGKSAGIAIPALLDWSGPAVASSIKTDLVGSTIARRRALGEVFVFDPFGLSAERTHTWSPLHAAHTWDGALEVAWRLASAGELDRRSMEGGDFWAVAAEQRLAPLLYAAATSGAGMDTVVRWVHGQGIRELDQALLIAGEGGHAAYDAVRAFEAQADRTRTSIEATAQTLLRAYRFGRVVRSAESCEITADRLLDGPATLYLIGDAKASKLLRPIFLALLGEVVDRAYERATLYLIGDAKASKLLRPIFLALLSEIVDRAYERATLAGGRLDSPLLLCLDEAGNVAPLPNLAEIASTAPSHNIQLVSIFHDLAQARSRYGQQAETVVNSHRARMLLPGVADLETLRYFSGLAGDEEAPDRTRTTGSAGTSRSTATRRRPLVAPEALRQLAPGRAMLLYGRIAPTELTLRMWFTERQLRRLAAAK
ncbi:MAG TPA: type IV secretory system conjugative DNA transfer family protein [Solirubrobacteraceae bacterium]|nr:type IV secretory system conjugative DNA transfer family protein [Solirubrobacteraceae bacterium]